MSAEQGRLLSEDERIQNIANLQVDPRPPVYIDTNLWKTNIKTALTYVPLDFRFFWDFNRNRMFETNGFQRELLADGSYGKTNFYVGDPEFIGVLENPNRPHSTSNRLVGRFAYIVLPAGKSLDLNHIHNAVKPIANDNDRFYRNQGVGSWEINLAAFLAGLNTNSWYTNFYSYNTNLNAINPKDVFNDAYSLLRYRYITNVSYSLLQNATNFLGPNAALAFKNNAVDDYSDGPRMKGVMPWPAANDNDNPERRWPGSDNPRPFSDIQQLLESCRCHKLLPDQYDEAGI